MGGFRLDTRRVSTNNPEDLQHHGIADAIDTLLRRRKEIQDWENAVAESGGQITTQERPSPMGVLRSVGGAIRRRLPGYNAHEPERAAASLAGRQPSVSITPTAEEADTSIMLKGYAPPTVTSPGRGFTQSTGEYGKPDYVPSKLADDFVIPTTKMPDTRNQTIITRGADTSLRSGHAGGGAPDRPEIERTIVRGPGGRSAIIPTTRGKWQQQQYDTEDAQARDRDRQIEALVRGGVSRPEAEARVQTNTVRYDDEFGQQYSRGSSSTFAQRMAIQAQQQTDRIALAEIKAKLAMAVKANDPLAVRRLTLEGQRLEAQMRRDAASLYTIENREDPLPRPGMEEAVATNTPEGAAAVEATKKRRADRSTKRREAATGGGAVMRGGGAATPQPKAKYKITQAEYDQWRKNYSDTQLALTYDLSGIVRDMTPLPDSTARRP